MNQIEEEGERRILEGVCSLIAMKIQNRIPDDKRGIRAADQIRSQVRSAVLEAMEGVVDRLSAEISGDIDILESPVSSVPEIVTEAATGPVSLSTDLCACGHPRHPLGDCSAPIRVKGLAPKRCRCDGGGQ